MAEINEAKQYQREKQILSLSHLGLTPLILLSAVFFPFSLIFKEWASAVTLNPYVAAAIYFLFLSLYILIFDLPMAFYSGFVLEHKFHLSNQSFGAWFWDFMKKSMFSFLLSCVLILALYALIWHQPTIWWLWAWAGYAAVSYVLGKLFPVLIVPLFYKYSRVENESLKSKILNLAKKFKMPLENVYSINLSKTTKKANAAFMGMGKTKRVVLSDTLIEKFTEGEIETVVAHELGHFIHKDIWKQLIIGLFTSFAGFFIAFKLLDGVALAFSFQGAHDVAAMPLLFLIFYAFSLILMPLQNGYSRKIEFAADRFALKVTADLANFVSCMTKLAEVNLADPSPHPVYEWFFYDHPAIGKRIKRAEQIMKFGVFAITLILLSSSSSYAAEKTKTREEEAIERRQRVELMSFFLNDPKNAKVPGTTLGVELFNQAVTYYQKNDYVLARQTLRESLAMDKQNAYAYELMGDIDSLEQKLDDAKANYEIAYNLQANARVKQKLEGLHKEVQVDKKLKIADEEHFLIKYSDTDKTVESFELKELLRSVYREISKDFGFYFKRKVTVLLYSEEDFKKLTNLPHWVGGVYDGKVRMPVTRGGYRDADLKALTAHEVTHAFVAAIAQAQGIPAWINEGLAQYEENKVRKLDMTVFKAAIKTRTLMPIDLLLSSKTVDTLSDPLLISLFYRESFHLVSYMINRYGLFRMKQILVELGKGQTSEEAIRTVLKISTQRLEKEWHATF